MDPSSLIPVPDALPVHWFWLQFLLTITTFLHLVAMNILIGSGFIAFVSPFSLGEEATPLCHTIAGKIPYIIAATINLGVAPLLFLQVLYGQFFYTSTILMAVYWLAIVAFLIITYYSAYIFYLRHKQLGDNRSFFIGVTVLLLVVVAFFFCNNISIMQLPETWGRYFESPDGWLVNLQDKSLIPRYLHFIASGVAIGGLAIAVYYEFRSRQGDSAAQRWINYGCNWFTIATMINFGIGFWFLGVLPPFAHNAENMLGKLFAVFLYGSVATTIVAVIHAQRRRVFPAAVWALITILMMTIARDLVRLAYLKPYFSLADLPVAAQYSPMLFFLIFLAVGGVLVWWMLKIVWSREEVH